MNIKDIKEEESLKRTLEDLDNKMIHVTKDSGKRKEYKSGMRRDTQEGKANFYLCLAHDVPFEKQMLTRWAQLMERGEKKYGSRNWELSNNEDDPDALERFKSSAFRHFVQWITDVDDGEDHASAVFFNITAAERLK